MGPYGPMRADYAWFVSGEVKNNVKKMRNANCHIISKFGPRQMPQQKKHINSLIKSTAL